MPYSASMKVFISSAIRGLEPFREAAVRAAAALRHEVKRSEDFGATAVTPQQACLAGVRWAHVVVLLLGACYGERQPSGLSATHEEYHEAKSRCSVLAFVERGVEPEAAQQEFIDEVRGWAGGLLTGEFASPEELQDAVTRALHELELAQQAGPVDESEMADRAWALIPDRYGLQGAMCGEVGRAPPAEVPSKADPTSLPSASMYRRASAYAGLGTPLLHVLVVRHRDFIRE